MKQLDLQKLIRILRVLVMVVFVCNILALFLVMSALFRQVAELKAENDLTI